MKKYIIFLIISLLGLYAFDSLNDKKERPPSIESIKGVELYGNEDYVFLDVRTEKEHRIKAIPNTPVVPVQELEARIHELKKYKDKKIIVYCRSGNRSRKGTDILIEHGFNAVNLLGGMIQWKGPITSSE